jgi:hypothetical protein
VSLLLVLSLVPLLLLAWSVLIRLRLLVIDRWGVVFLIFCRKLLARADCDSNGRRSCDLRGCELFAVLKLPVLCAGNTGVSQQLKMG